MSTKSEVKANSRSFDKLTSEIKLVPDLETKLLQTDRGII